MKPNPYAIRIQGLVHLFDTRTRRFVLSIPEFNVPTGSLTSILGSSGCGKTTLLSVAGLIQLPSEGSSLDFSILDSDIASLIRDGNFSEIERIRRRSMGFYMQGGELISTLTLRENVAMPLRLNGVSSWQAYERADYLLSFLLGPNSKSQRNKLANECSGGEAQRVAIARSLAHQPKILFIDEPTSNLDAQNKRRVLDLMVSLVRSENVTVVNISHDQELAIEYSNFMLRLTADPVGWGELIDHEFRPTEDGFGKPASYAAKIDGHWVPTDAAFQPFVTNQLDFEGDNQNAA